MTFLVYGKMKNALKQQPDQLVGGFPPSPTFHVSILAVPHPMPLTRPSKKQAPPWLPDTISNPHPKRSGYNFLGWLFIPHAISCKFHQTTITITRGYRLSRLRTYRQQIDVSISCVRNPFNHECAKKETWGSEMHAFWCFFPFCWSSAAAAATSRVPLDHMLNSRPSPNPHGLQLGDVIGRQYLGLPVTHGGGWTPLLLSFMGGTLPFQLT